ncbi:hypothetical protein J437_LFUL013002 [Ladona fulva]|uniref:Peptidyl-prolyl cis-trans isomerase n=1 Tax=Ladona fulva TaxID=123851 RepID=A0A8K0KD32_LADFU|nr:hypothetical protein J437_LFUL013002 [Ladona fulva]
MEFMAGKEYLGMIVAELYEDIVPLTVKNFMFFCQNGNNQEKRKPRKDDKEKILTYTGCPVHRIVPNYYMQSGDVLAHNGSDGKSIYGPVFDDENFILKHSKPGVISMANRGPNTNNSQFMITFRKLETLNGVHVVLGRVIQGLDTLLKVEDFGTSTGRPRAKVIILKCGILQK